MLLYLPILVVSSLCKIWTMLVLYKFNFNTVFSILNNDCDVCYRIQSFFEKTGTWKHWLEIPEQSVCAQTTTTWDWG